MEMGLFSLSLAFLAFVTIVPFQEGVAIVPQCPNGWGYINGHCYGLFTTPAPWHEAELQCRDFRSKGHLVSIHNQEEAKAVVGFMKAQRFYGPVWIGLFTETRGLWLWTDNSKYDYAAWAPREPDYQGKYMFYCVQLYPTKGQWLWDDTDCDIAKAYVCKAAP